MIQELMLGLAVYFAFVSGSLLGYLTSEEGKKIRKSKLAKSLRRYGLITYIFYSIILGLTWNYFFDLIELVSLIIFGLIIVQTSTITTNKLDKKILFHGFVFLVIFFAIIFLK